MTDINTAIIVGRLTKDIDLKYSNSGLPIGDGSVAVNRSIKNKDGSYSTEASFFNFKILGKMAENLRPYLQKGKQVAIEGFLKQDAWTDNDGLKHSTVYIGVNNIELLGGKSENLQGEQKQQNYNQNVLSNSFEEDYPF